MARPFSEKKRSAILSAATEIVAVEGVEAATARIARAAGVAEGTVFTYFPTKDALLNELYLTIKSSVAEAVLAGQPGRGDVTVGLRAIWTNYIRWGIEHAAERRAMVQLGVSGRLTAETRALALQSFSDVDALLRELIADRFEGSLEFASAIMSALAETSMQFILADPRHADAIADHGFKALVRALSGAA